MEETKPYNSASKLSNEEEKEKLILDFYFLRSEMNSLDTDKKNLTEIKKISQNIEKKLEEILQIDIPLKTKKDYVNLKKTNLDESLLRFAKYLK